MTAPHTLSPLFRRLTSRTPLSPGDRAALADLPFRTTSIDPGGYIVREGDKANRCCVLLSGFVYRHKITGDGDRQILSIHLRGDAVDLQNGLLDHADHNVQALTRANVAFVARKAIVDLCADRPRIAHALWVDTLVDAAIFREWIVNVGRRNARQRIAHLFCEMALRQEAAGLCTGPHYVWPMTQVQVGDATGLTAVHVNRTLRDLKAEKLITMTSTDVRIENWAGLQEAGDFNPGYLHLPPGFADPEL